MYKPFIFLNVIIIITILLFTGSLNAQRIGSSKNAAESGLHRDYKYHENIRNRNNSKVRVKSKNKFHQRNRVQESHEGRYGHKNFAVPAWLNDTDIFPGVSISPPSINDR